MGGRPKTHRARSTGAGAKAAKGWPGRTESAGAIGLVVLCGGALVLSASGLQASPSGGEETGCIDLSANTALPANSEMCDLGTLPGNTRSLAYGVSGDGSVVVGRSRGGDVDDSAFRWDSVTGMQSLGILDGGSESRALDVNADGTVIVGNSGSSAGFRAFRWTSATGMQSLGGLPGGGESWAYGVSADGSVIVGEAITDQYRIHAFVWTENTGMRDLGALDGGFRSAAFDVNADGTVIVGTGLTVNGETAFRWTESTGMQGLGYLPGGSESYGYGVNADGTVVVGSSGTADGVTAFRWVLGSGMQSLGRLAGGTYSSARDVNADGTVVVGVSDISDGPNLAFRWEEGSGMQSLGTLSGGYSSRAYSVSDDGLVVVGESTSEVGDRAFIWRSRMQDLTNLIGSFSVLAGQTDLAFAQHRDTIAQMAGETPWAMAGRSVMRGSVAGRRAGGAAGEGGGDDNVGNALVSYGYGAADSLTLGFTLGTLRGADAGAYDLDSGRAVALWGSYSEGGPDRTGWQGDIALGWGSADAAITRGEGLTDVILSRGTAQMETRLARASVGYGFDHASGWRMTPSLGIARYTTTRDAYSESGGDFNASYDALTVGRTSVTLALSAETAVSDRGSLSLRVGVERDLSDGMAELTGTSDVPGMATLATQSTAARNRTRGSLSLGYGHDLGNGAALTTTIGLAGQEFGGPVRARVGMSYEMRF